MSEDQAEGGTRAGVILLAVATLAALAGTVALGFAAFAFPAQAISNWFLSLMILLCLFLLGGMGVGIWTVARDSEAPVGFIPLVAFAALILAGLSAWVAYNIPSYGYYTLRQCLAQSVCLVPYGASGTYLYIAAACFGASFLLSLLAFRQI
ncbi:MAG TPA: hypothetical protein VF898_10500 [Chloroflexota bacterium]